MTTQPPELSALLERMAELDDLRAIGRLLTWDQHTMMPSAGTAARANHAATLEALCHNKLVDPEVGRLLEKLEGWVAGRDPDSDDVRIVRVVERDYRKATQVPSKLAAELSHAAIVGQQVWQEPRAQNDFGLFRDALARQLELTRRYADCFSDFAEPYDALLDDYEPDLTTAQLRPLLEELREGLVPLVAATGDPNQDCNAGVLCGDFPVDLQRHAVREIVKELGFDERSWRLDSSAHPFADAVAVDDVRITTKYDQRDFGVAFYPVLHEFGHGMYEASVAPQYARTLLGTIVSLGVHESQSRLWENTVGRSRPFCIWVLPRLQKLFPGKLDDLTVDALYHGVNSVQQSAIRIYADETTYNLHIILRFELELALLEGSLQVDDLPTVWNQKMYELLGIDITNDADGVLQDIHWAGGSFGYFPTYTLGNLVAASLWDQMRGDLPVDEAIQRGDFATLHTWLRENIHRHGRKYNPRELVHRITGDELRVAPFLDYLGEKLTDAGVATRTESDRS